jgi:sigma-B regulation protein RsbU (phosphoserine phosphatase)
MKVLLIDDDRVTRIRVCALLEGWGHQTVTASDGLEGLSLFQKERPDLVLTDWLMPGLDGVELVRHLRQESTASGRFVYVIMLTARTETADLVEGFEAGVNDFIKKPVENEELHARIRAGLRIIELERALAQQNRARSSANREVRAANRRMRRELQAAAKIQSSFLPSRLPNSDRASFAWRYEPCEELSGDTLNILELAPGRVGLFVMDVSGHGVSAALLSVHVSRLFTRLDDPDSIVRHGLKDGADPIEAPHDVALRLNELFPCDPAGDELQYFTMLYGVLDLGRRQFNYTSAGHPGPIIIPRDQSERIIVRPADPPAVGFFAAPDFAEHSVNLSPGDRIYLYTDGIFEMTNPSGEAFGKERLASTLAAHRDQTLDDSVRLTLDAARAWTGGRKLKDDVSLLGAEIA